VTPDGGGIQRYIEQGFGATAGFVVTWAFWVGVWTSNAALAIASASATSRIIPALSGTTSVALLSIGYIVILTGINARGALSAGRTAVLTSLLKILPLIAVIVAFALLAEPGTAIADSTSLPVSFGGIASATVLTLFALSGFETATAPVGKIRNPARNIPLAMLCGTAFVAILYILASTSVMLLLSPAKTAVSAAPFADAIATQWGEGPANLVALGMAISAFGCLNGGVLAAGELSYSMASRGDLPQWLARTWQGTPVVAQVFAAGLSIVLVFLNMSKDTSALFTYIVLLSTSSTLILYSLATLAALKVSRSAWAVLVVSVALIFSMFAFYGAGMEANGWVLVLLIFGLAVRTIMRRFSGSNPAVAASPGAPPESAA
jgi:APA family basic amino acid/polyamine antiporter